MCPFGSSKLKVTICRARESEWNLNHGIEDLKSEALGTKPKRLYIHKLSSSDAQLLAQFGGRKNLFLPAPNQSVSLVRRLENDGNRNNINLINLTWFIFNVFSIAKDIFPLPPTGPHLLLVWIMESAAKLELLLTNRRYLSLASDKNSATSPKHTMMKRRRKKPRRWVWKRGRSTQKRDNRTRHKKLGDRKRKRIVNANFIITFLCPLSGVSLIQFCYHGFCFSSSYSPSSPSKLTLFVQFIALVRT